MENELSGNLNLSTLRQRKRPIESTESPCHVSKAENITPRSLVVSGVSMLFWASCLFGFILMVATSWWYATYVSQLHENAMWFSNIKEVEREISFRTESGLYYSYYKQLLSAPSLVDGLYALTRDNITEHPSTINVLARMNIYQEVFLASLYRSLPFLQKSIEPVYFYIRTVFALHGLLLCSLFAISWLLSGTWMAGLLTALFYIVNRVDVTRVEQWIPLRENFSLPFLWAQLAAVTAYFRPTLSRTAERYCQSAIFIFTFLFAITWQFNQFALLLQAMALFGVQVLMLVNHHKILNIFLSQAFAMLIVFVLQFCNEMIITGILLSFLLSAMFVMWCQSQLVVDCNAVTPVRYVLRIVGQTALVFLMTFLLNSAAKLIVRQEADEHIFKFVLTKLGFSEPSRDFDVRLYLCNGAFTYLDATTFVRLSRHLVFPIYGVFHLGLLVVLLVCMFRRCRSAADVGCKLPNSDMFSERPELAYHIIQAVFFGAVGLMAVRMKYFWTPYMCIIASVSLADKNMWVWLLAKCHCCTTTLITVLRHVVLLCVFAAVLYIALPPIWVELQDLREFYDPDTVDLMEWIKNSTAPAAAFSGSMQLLAGVKLCTGRHITNHPHYEDKSLRQKTKELYQMYGRQTPELIFSILNKYSVNYIILEDSICLAPSNGGCRLPDIVDVDNGIVPDHGAHERGLVRSTTPRFCDEIRHARSAYSDYFQLVFENRTFRVYKLHERVKPKS